MVAQQNVNLKTENSFEDEKVSTRLFQTVICQELDGSVCDEVSQIFEALLAGKTDESILKRLSHKIVSLLERSGRQKKTV